MKPKGFLSLLFNGEARRARKAAHEFNRLVQAYDDAIANARRRHHPTASLIAAKAQFVHQRLGAELGR